MKRHERAAFVDGLPAREILTAREIAAWKGRDADVAPLYAALYESLSRNFLTASRVSRLAEARNFTKLLESMAMRAHALALTVGHWRRFRRLLDRDRARRGPQWRLLFAVGQMPWDWDPFPAAGFLHGASDALHSELAVLISSSRARLIDSKRWRCAEGKARTRALRKLVTKLERIESRLVSASARIWNVGERLARAA
jgi:hypothetical protein